MKHLFSIDSEKSVYKNLFETFNDKNRVKSDIIYLAVFSSHSITNIDNFQTLKSILEKVKQGEM